MPELQIIGYGLGRTAKQAMTSAPREAPRPDAGEFSGMIRANFAQRMET